MEAPRIRIGTDTFLPAHISEKESYTAVTIIGPSGTGKTSLAENIARWDGLYPFSKVYIDPSGFSARKVYSLWKGNAAYLSLDTPVGINPMMSGYEPNQICSTVAESINRVITATTPNERLTVKMREILDEAVKWCIEHNRPSLLHVRDRLKVLTGHSEARDGLLARLNFLITNEKMIPILCGQDAIRWGKFIAEGKNLVVDCHGMSREEFIFIGTSILHGIVSYFRYEKPKEYRPMRVTVDEANNFLTPLVGDVIREARKYKISFLFLLQMLPMDAEMERLFLNAGNILAFRAGARDSSLLSKEMLLNRQDLQQLPKYHFAYKTPSRRGIAKADSPPIITELPLRKVEPQRKSSGWFPLESYQTGGTTI